METKKIKNAEQAAKDIRANQGRIPTKGAEAIKALLKRMNMSQYFNSK